MKTEKKKTLRGSVLFTVVCVMALLIIFLTGTLALASAAGNRAHRSYSISQASYTARTAIESFTQAMVRDKSIEAAVEELGEGGTLKELHPKVVIPDKTLGQIGYINSTGDWVEDRIEVTPINGSGEYRLYDNDGKGAAWHEVKGVKVTATCKVGREYETVSAYIQKSPSTGTKDHPGGINGLQEADGNTFPNGALITGGLGIGVGSSVADAYHMHNNQDIETTLMFVNSDLIGGTSTNQIFVKKPTDKDNADKPYSQTVITGSLMVENDSFIVNDYEMTESYTQKEVPYLYVDGLICQEQTSSLKLVTGNNAPFNVFAGTLVPKGPVKINGDLYLMDKNDGSTITAKYVDRTGNEVPNKAITEPRGVNFFGADTDGNELYEWSKSVIQRQETQFNSTGGSIYCMGDLTIRHATIRGDVRVEGKCTIGSGVTIYGDLVVGGHLSFNNQNPNKIVKGHIYNSDNDGTSPNMDGLKPGYSYHIDEIYPGYIEVPSVTYENTPVPDVEAWTDEKQNHDPWGYELTYPDGTVEYLGNTNESHKTIYVQKDTLEWWDNVPYYVTNANGTDDTNKVVFDKYSRYIAEPDGSMYYEREDDGTYKVGADGEKIAVATDDGSTFYKEPETPGGEYVRVDRSDAVGTYYLDKDGKMCSEGDAKGSLKADDILPYSEYVNKNGSAYPSNMTRENIWGKKDSATGFTPAPEKTKIVKTLQEVRKDLGFNEKGEFDGAYYSDVPDEYIPEAGLPYAYVKDTTTQQYVLNPAVSSNGVITQSCIIGDPDDSTKQFNVPGNDKNPVRIKAQSEIWVVLRNMSLAGGNEIIVDESSAKVNFLFDGTLNRVQNGKIRSSAFKEGMTVRYDMNWGIEFYASEGAKLKLENNDLFTGTFKAPTLVIYPSDAGPWSVKYVDEYGSTPKSFKPVIVGSALIGKFDVMSGANMNEFAILNTGKAGSGTGGSSFKGTFGWYDVTYYMGV